MASLGESGKIGVVFDVDSGNIEVGLEKSGEIEVFPGEVAKPNGAITLNDAWHGDGDSFDI